MTGLIVLLIVIVITFIVFIVLVFPGELPNQDRQLLWDWDYAHRGLHQEDGSIIENSLMAFKEAVDGGFGIELDLQLSKDKKVVVFHDDNLLRVCGIDKKINACTYEELKIYSLGQTDERIPLFTEVLSLVDEKVPLLVELKNVVSWKELCEKTADHLDSYSGDYRIESFHPGIVRWFYKKKPLVIRGQLSAARNNFEDTPKWQGFLIANLMTNVLSRPHFVAYKIEDARWNMPLRVYRFLSGVTLAWTLRDKETLKAAKMPFDAIIFEFMTPDDKRY